MFGISVEITRFVNDAFPGFVECRFSDVDGKEWRIVEKIPVVTTDWLDAASQYPQKGIVGCQVTSRKYVDGREVITVDTELPWHIDAVTGETKFDIRPEQLIEFDWPRSDA
jgi:hypothetical protein